MRCMVELAAGKRSEAGAREAKIAARLRAAYREGAIEPICVDLPEMDMEAAYRVQNTNTEYWLSAGRQLAGHKIGLTAAAVQKQLGVDQPDYGILFADMAVADGGAVALDGLLQPKVEAEIALRLRADLEDPVLSVEELPGTIEWLAAAIEIVDSRIKGWRIKLVDTIADNASSALFVLGGRRVPPTSIDVVNASMRLHAGDHLASEGRGAFCMGSPYLATLWLARKMIELGRPLRAGQVVLTGALGPMVSVEPQVTYVAEVDGLGAVSVTFGGKARIGQ